MAIQTAVFTRTASARRPLGLRARRARGTLGHSDSKGNALRYSTVLWDEVADEVAAQYPAVQYERVLVDAAA